MDQATVDLIVAAVSWTLIIGGIGLITVAMIGLHMTTKGAKVMSGAVKSG